MTIALINDQMWDEWVINNPRPTLVTFTSPHCSYCSLMGYHLESAANIRPNIDIYAIDITQSPDTKNYYGIDGTPRSILFIDGRERATLRGYQLTGTIVEFLDEHLPKQDT